MPSDRASGDTEHEWGKPSDAEYCPACAYVLAPRDVEMFADELLDRYRIQFSCGGCGYRGEIIRHESVRNNRSRDTDTDHNGGGGE